jgi:hypothetical protein
MAFNIARDQKKSEPIGPLSFFESAEEETVTQPPEVILAKLSGLHLACQTAKT